MAAGAGANDDEIVSHNHARCFFTSPLWGEVDPKAKPEDRVRGDKTNEERAPSPARLARDLSPTGEVKKGNQRSSTSRAGSSRQSFTRTRNVTACWPST